MIYYTDLLNKPYKPHGRGNGGFDCYGLVLECLRREGKTVNDPFRAFVNLPEGAEIEALNDFNNIREIPAPKVGAVAECLTGENLHVAYIVAPGLAIHCNRNGVKVTNLAFLNPIRYYEVLENDCKLNSQPIE